MVDWDPPQPPITVEYLLITERLPDEFYKALSYWLGATKYVSNTL